MRRFYRGEVLMALLSVLFCTGTAVGQITLSYYEEHMFTFPQTPVPQACGTDQSNSDQTKWQNPLCADGAGWSVTSDLAWLALSGDGTSVPKFGWKFDLTATNPTDSVVWLRYDFFKTDGLHSQQAQIQRDDSGPLLVGDSNASPLEPHSTHVLHVTIPADGNVFANGTFGGSILVTHYSTDAAAVKTLAGIPGLMVRQQFVCYFNTGLNVPIPAWLSQASPTLRQSEIANEWVVPMQQSSLSSRYWPNTSGKIMDYAVKNTTPNTEIFEVSVTDGTGATQLGCSTTFSLDPNAAVAHAVFDVLPEACFPEPTGIPAGQLHVKLLKDGNYDTFVAWGLQLVGPAATGVLPF